MSLSNEDFRRIMICACEAGISDVHICKNAPVFWRRGGVLSPLREYIPTSEDIWRIFKRISSDDILSEFAQNKSADFAWSLQEWRYRCHAYKKDGSIAFAFRVIQRVIPPIDEIGQAAMIKHFLAEKHGLLLITGATNAGKSTTAASFLQTMNAEQDRHILTLEDPVEYLFPKGRGLISQRERGEDFVEFGDALRDAMREDPDVIMVSELRDRYTAEQALGVAATGHFVIATMHTGSAVETMERFINMFSAERQPLARSILASVLIGVLTQTLIADDLGTRHCIAEMLVANPAARNIIRSGKYEQLNSIIQAGKAEGMQSMETGYKALLEDMPDLFSREIASQADKKGKH